VQAERCGQIGDGGCEIAFLKKCLAAVGKGVISFGIKFNSPGISVNGRVEITFFQQGVSFIKQFLVLVGIGTGGKVANGEKQDHH